MNSYIISFILILSTIHVKAQLKNTSIDFKVGQSYVTQNSTNVYPDPQNPSTTIFSNIFRPGYNAKIGLNKIIFENERKEIVLNAMLNYWTIGIQIINDANEEDETNLHFSYAGSELHYIPSLYKKKLKASIGVGLYAKIYGNSTNKNFDPDDNTKLLNAKNKPINPFIIVNTIVGLGYSKNRITYWLRYNYSVNQLLKISSYRGTSGTHLTQTTIGVSFKLKNKDNE